MADIMTFEEQKGPINGHAVAWVGDGNNVAVSWMHAAVRFGFELRVACPDELRPEQSEVDWVKREKGTVSYGSDAVKAVRGVDCVVTDTWVSMGQTDAAQRKKMLQPYAVDAKLMKAADKDAIFMHCLPAYRGKEVTEDVIDGPQSVVFDEAENRLHVQKAILAWSLGV
jgi:ornithine carbamoyltransferase